MIKLFVATAVLVFALFADIVQTFFHDQLK